MRRLAPIGCVALVAGAACYQVLPRAPCVRDGDCTPGEVCYSDLLCIPADVARRRGGRVGDDCRIAGSGEQGCAAGEVCRMGSCDHAPRFEGASQALSEGESAIVVHWHEAVDETPAAVLRYYLYLATAPGAHDFSSPAQSVVGETSARFEDLDAGAMYYFVVRAEDEFGQSDANVIEVSAVPGCVEYATQLQPLLDDRCVSCHISSAAPRHLELDTFEHVLAGSDARDVIVPCSSEQSFLYMKVAQALPPIGSRMPWGGPYLDRDETDMIRRWIDRGAERTCAAPSRTCGDDTSPVFAGLASVTEVDSSHVRLCWAAAVDDDTPSEQIVYEVYEGLEPGAQDFDGLPRARATAGASCITLAGRVPDEQYCWVVRARDGAANRDTNAEEICHVVPAVSCVEYEDVIQPLLRDRCTHCHGGPVPFRNLRLESYEGVLAGGQSGGEIVSCAPDESLLYAKISRDRPPIGIRMPADGPPYLSDAQIAAVRQWIAEGARQSCADPSTCTESPGSAEAEYRVPQLWGHSHADASAPAALHSLRHIPGYDSVVRLAGTAPRRARCVTVFAERCTESVSRNPSHRQAADPAPSAVLPLLRIHNGIHRRAAWHPGPPRLPGSVRDSCSRSEHLP